jgi:MYXO-CTERM domain-containing protein
MSGVLTLPPPQPAVFMETTQPDLGTYTLSQSVTLTGINNNASNFNYTANSGVTPTPEPSSMAIAGLGALGLIGYGIRRRRGA